VDFFFDLLTKPFLFIVNAALENFGMQAVEHPVLVFEIQVAILILLFIFTIFLGWIAQKLFFGFLIQLFQKIVRKIPVVNSVYRILEQVTKSFFDNKNPFSQAVVVEFPNSDTKTIAFLAGKLPQSIESVTKEPHASIFVPTAPHPLSGFLLFSPESRVKKIDISSEEVFKILFSCGTYNPHDPKNPSHVP
jgi:uncharacterized membrane protein